MSSSVKPRVEQWDSANVAYEILASVFGFFPTEDSYESMAGTQSRDMTSDSTIFKMTNEFTPRNQDHQYMEAGFNKDARITAQQWKNNGNKPIEQTYWAYTTSSTFHSELDIIVDAGITSGLAELVTFVKINGKPEGRIREVHLAFTKMNATFPFTNALADDLRNTDWYDTLLVPFPPLHEWYDLRQSFDTLPIDEYNNLQNIIHEYEKKVALDPEQKMSNSNLYHAVMHFPTLRVIGKTNVYDGYIAVMPSSIMGHVSFSNMALLELVEDSEGMGVIKPSFGEDAFKIWKLLRPETRYQSINKQIVL